MGIDALKLDKAWCSKTQLPASMILFFSNDTTKATRLALLRLSVALCLFMELLGFFFITFGLASIQTSSYLLIGIVLKVAGGVFSSFFQNKAGILLSLELQHYVSNLKKHDQEIRSLLSDKGCTEAEINALSFLPSDIYQTELNSYRRTSLLNFGAPIACGIGLLVVGDLVTAITVIVLGLLAFPIGEHFFHEHTFRHDAQLRIGKSAQALKYLQKVYDEHIGLTLRVNFLSQIPLILFGLKFVWNNLGGILASFFGLTQGLIGLTGTLAFQRSRVTSLRATETATHLINALASKTFIITPTRWKEHCSLYTEDARSVIPLSHEFNGVVFENFAAQISLKRGKSTSLPALSCVIPSGGICLLHAPSGYGKSTFLMALVHLVEHNGNLYFIRKGKKQNVHDFTQDSLEQKIFFIREDNIDKSARLLDLFKEVFHVRFETSIHEMNNKYGHSLTELAWNAADNLIEQEIENIKIKRKSVFPINMFEPLLQMREQRYNLLQSMLQNAGGNIASERVNPERTFSSLSSGEKRRILTLLAFETTCVNPDIELIILDEPLSHLDSDNLKLQLGCIHHIQNADTSPAILIISHHHLDEITSHLSQVNTLHCQYADCP